MGYQQSFVKFKNEKSLVEEIKKYTKRDTSKDDATVYCVIKAVKDVKLVSSLVDVEIGEYLVVVGGDRYTQRSAYDIFEFLGLSKVIDIIFIDDIGFELGSSYDLGEFIDEHFHELEDSELDELLEKY